ncbi:hypothetical protein [Capnocytophaga canis]|uniref:hypothetical protein n=1 Tax=Capnocytophaga canis TaxID=1848903 RepID=UPI001562010E|nr:hypothetical protein [Capnocytophaga canis]
MNTLANTQIPQYINIQGKKLAIIPAEHYEELVQKVEFYEEEENFTEQELKSIEISHQQAKVGEVISGKDLIKKLRNRDVR